MNEREWHDIQRIWKSAPQQAEPITKELQRFQRRRKWLPFDLVVQAIIALVGFSVGVAMIARGGAFFVAAGSATCAFVTTVCALSLWAWLTAPLARPEDAVGHAVAVARQHARATVQQAAAMIWALIAGLVFAAAMAFARGFFGTEATLGGYVVIGGIQLMLAAWFGLAFRHYRARSADLARLEAIAAALEQ
jgi:hypothetical protein